MRNSRAHETIDELVREFVDATVQQHIEIDRGSAKGASVASRRRVRAFKRLTSRFGDRGREALKVLFSYPNGRVRSLAASYLLRYCTDDALAVLRDVAENEEGLTKMGAECSIMNWEKGEWSLDP